MGDGEQTELAPSEAETSSARAWGLADDVDDLPTQRITPSRITTAAVVASLAVTAIAATVAFQHLHHDGAPAASPASMIQATTAARPKPQLLDGTYRIFHDWSNTTYRNNERVGGGAVHWKWDGMPENTFYTISSTCTETDCIATANQIVDRGWGTQNSEPIVIRLVNGSWQDMAPLQSQSQCVDVATGKQNGESTYLQRISFDPPQIDGTLHGALMTTVESDDCGDRGDTSITPIIMARTGDRS